MHDTEMADVQMARASLEIYAAKIGLRSLQNHASVQCFHRRIIAATFIIRRDAARLIARAEAGEPLRSSVGISLEPTTGALLLLDDFTRDPFHMRCAMVKCSIDHGEIATERCGPLRHRCYKLLIIGG